MTPTDLSAVTRFLDETLQSSLYSDSCQNGLQVDAGNAEVRRIGFAVDAGESVIEEAVSRGLDLLVVHHGLFWSATASRLIGPMGRKVRSLIKGGCSLYASHLPLDGHPEYGNAAQIARTLGLQEVLPFCHYKGGPVGCRGRFPTPTTIEQLIAQLEHIPGRSPQVFLPFGASTFSTVAIVTGSGSFAIEECAACGIDLLLSGEPKHEAYHLAKEVRQSALFAGHYATETFGVRALQELLRSSFGVETCFVDEPSGI